MAREELGAQSITTYSGGLACGMDAVGGPNGGDSSAGVTNFAVAQPAQCSGVIIAAVAVHISGGSYASYTRSCTINGTAMTYLGAVNGNNTAGNGWIEAYIATVSPGSTGANYTINYSISAAANIGIVTNTYNGVSSWNTSTNFGTGTTASSGSIASAPGRQLISLFSSPPGTYFTASYPYTWESAASAVANFSQAAIVNTPGANPVSATVTCATSGAWACLNVELLPNNYSVSGVAVPAGIKGVWVTLIGCGGAGSGGCVGGSGLDGGSGGGGGGGILNYYVPAALLGSTYSVTIPGSPVSGQGTLALATGGANGSNGESGGGTAAGISAGNVIFTSGSTTLEAVSGGSALQVSNSSTAGAGGSGYLLGGAGGLCGYSTSNAATAGSVGGTTGVLGAGGGGGWGPNAACTAAPGGDAVTHNQSGGAAGTLASVAGSPGSTPVAFTPGSGGGGGYGGSTATNGGPGGAGLGYGAGGGGGGAGGGSTTHTYGGAGGPGGPGFCGLVWDYK